MTNPAIKRWQVANEAFQIFGYVDAESPHEAVLNLAEQRGWGNWTKGDYLVREIGPWQPVAITDEVTK